MTNQEARRKFYENDMWNEIDDLECRQPNSLKEIIDFFCAQEVTFQQTNDLIYIKLKDGVYATFRVDEKQYEDKDFMNFFLRPAAVALFENVEYQESANAH